MKEEQIIEELKKLGWHYCYLGGHGTEEVVTESTEEGYFVVGDIEKSRILVPPDCIWKDKVKYEDYY